MKRSEHLYEVVAPHAWRDAVVLAVCVAVLFLILEKWGAMAGFVKLALYSADGIGAVLVLLFIGARLFRAVER